MSTIQVAITESENGILGERVRVVGMCFYGCGRDLTKNHTYQLWHNTANPKDDTCIDNGVLPSESNSQRQNIPSTGTTDG